MKSTTCEYFENCSVAKISGRNCADYKNCQTYKFYQRYPESLGIGAMMIPPKRTMTKELIDKLFEEDMRDY